MRSARRAGDRALIWAAVTVLLVIYVFPFAYMILTSFKTRIDAIAIPPAIWPREWTLDNYAIALGGIGVVPSFLNSMQTAAMSTVLTLVLAVPAAFAVSWYTSVSTRAFGIAALVTRMVPPVAIGVPLSGIMVGAGLGDTTIALAIAHTTIALPLAIWLMIGFFDAIPKDLEEAARVDGCGRLGALRRVILPLTGGGLAVTALFAFLTSWNEFLFALLMTSLRSQTTPILIANYQTQFNLDWGPMTALACLYSVPVILLTLLLQRHIVGGLTVGAVKG